MYMYLFIYLQFHSEFLLSFIIKKIQLSLKTLTKHMRVAVRHPNIEAWISHKKGSIYDFKKRLSQQSKLNGKNSTFF